MTLVARANHIFTVIESSLWRHRLFVLTLAGLMLTARHWTTLQASVIDASYPVAEMLINYADGFVRRGLSGEIILSLTQAFGGPPAIWASTMSGLLGIALFTMAIRIYARMPDTPSLLAVVLAPWGLMFLAYDPDVMVRKEVFGYLALCAVLSGTLSPQFKRARVYLISGCLLMPVAILLHEVNMGLAGSLLIAAWMFLRAHPQGRRLVNGWVGVSVVASTLAFGAVSLHATADPRVMCDAVNFVECWDPFDYFSDTALNGTALVRDRMSGLDFVIAVGLVVLGALPFCALRLPRHGPLLLAGPALLAVLAAVIALPVLPLFAVAVDYGRWIALIFFPASLLAATALAQGWIIQRAVLPPALTVLYCGTWSFYHWGVAPQAYGLWLWPMLAAAIALRWLYNRTLAKTLCQEAPL